MVLGVVINSFRNLINFVRTIFSSSTIYIYCVNLRIQTRDVCSILRTYKESCSHVDNIIIKNAWLVAMHDRETTRKVSKRSRPRQEGVNRRLIGKITHTKIENSREGEKLY